MYSPTRPTLKKFSNDQIIIQEQFALIESLEKKVESSNTSNFYKLTSLNIPERSKPDKKLYAKDLMSQIEEKSRLDKEKHKIQPEAICSLQLNSTPDNLRKEREKEKQLKVKQDLENQINIRTNWIKTVKNQKIEDEKKEFSEFLKKLEREDQEKLEMKMKEKEILKMSWNNQIKFKELKETIGNIESFGFNPRARSVLNIKKEVVPLDTVLEISKTDGILIEESPKHLNVVSPVKKLSYIEKAVNLKTAIEEKYKNSFQFKIKKILQTAKESRKSKSKSVSPARFLSKKRFELR